jgi:hypothetical protein
MARFPRLRGKLPEGLMGALFPNKTKRTPFPLHAAPAEQPQSVGITKLCSIASPPCGQRWVTVLVRV